MIAQGDAPSGIAPSFRHLMQTVIAVIIFDGWALGNWATWRMSQIAILVGCVWVLQLILSPIWLYFFRFGPAEWLWRSLTYWRIQPIAVKPVESEAVAA